nr:molybdopterin-guanine dinucleotide biosynthesis protein A [uncultured Candidatus Thioglobus sp.]
METIAKSDITALILAGGQAKRMNRQDKGLILFRNKPLISYVVNIISKNVDSILVSANRNIDLYQEFGEVITDDLPDFQGPLAGISTALNKVKTKYLLITPCDGPYVSELLLDRLVKAMEKKDTLMCVAAENEYLHPTFALINVSVAPVLSQYLDDGGRKLGKFFKDNRATEVDFSDQPKIFINLNSPEDFLSTKHIHSK